jgi:ABC-type transport system involved in cytochrome bd biosynthesis fused ATPase/permease subunit
MAIIKRTWTPREADEWTREDTITVVISPVVYILLTLGTALSFLLLPIGFLLLGLGIVLMLVMIVIINPKLTTISREYEKKQQKYLKDLEQKIQWQEES